MSPVNHLPHLKKAYQNSLDSLPSSTCFVGTRYFLGPTSLGAAGYEELLPALRGLCSETVPESGTSTFDFVHLPWKLTLIFYLGLAKMSPVRLKFFFYMYIYNSKEGNMSQQISIHNLFG